MNHSCLDDLDASTGNNAWVMQRSYNSNLPKHGILNAMSTLLRHVHGAYYERNFRKFLWDDINLLEHNKRLFIFIYYVSLYIFIFYLGVMEIKVHMYVYHLLRFDYLLIFNILI